MPPTNYFIGIGGTGARVAEALIHLCAAGLGPKEGLFLLLVDPDGGNGNLARTKALLNQYREARRAVSGMRGDFFRTEIRTGPGDEGLHWGVVGDNERLETYIQLQALETQKPELAHLANVLFTKAELETPLNEGFRGHPAIGAAIIASEFEASSMKEPWSSFWADVAKVGNAGNARVFLAGSIFGGTGAAGVPTFGKWKILKGNSAATEGMSAGQSKIRLGGCLVLPYFTFDTSAATQEGAMHVVPTDFPLATRAALDYYYDMKENLTFDELYLLGDSLKQDVGKFSAGAKNQANRPHYVELVAALAARDFWKNADGTPERKRYLLAAREVPAVSLASLPVTRREGEEVSEEQNRLRFQLVSMVLFSYTIAAYLAGKLNADAQVSDTWYQEVTKSFKKTDEESVKDPKSSSNRKDVEVIGKLGESFLRWMAAMSQDRGVQLVNAGALFDQNETSWDKRALLPAISNAGAIGQVYGQSKGTLDTFLNTLNGTNLGSLRTASEKLLDRFARASQTFAASELNVTRPREER